MASHATGRHAIYHQVLAHLLERIERTSAIEEPFTHIYFEEILPPSLYNRLLAALPEPASYQTASEKHHLDGEIKGYVRSQFALTTTAIPAMPILHQELWSGVSAALTDPALKRALFACLGKDLTYRYGKGDPSELVGHSRPTLYRETEGFEIPPHPDTRRKVVTMHFYLPADDSQIDLGTALYRHRLTLPFGSWQRRFEKVKQFAFRANSAYAFVVNNSIGKRSWHGREKLPPGAGVRNTLLNTFYEETREGYFGYLGVGQAKAA